jgi:outer membrane protein assembly factor BamD
MLRIKNLICLCFLGFFVLNLGACSSSEKNSDTPEGSYALAQEFEKEERFEEAIRRYNELKNKFPYSKFATMAELAIADSYYKQESFAEAQVAYQSFKDLHPRHAQIDYVTFRLGLSYFSQLPSTVDRDLTLASSSILFFEEVLSRFPNSEHAKEALEKKNAAVKMLAEKEEYIADFYFIREKYDSAMTRYEYLLSRYPGSGLDAKAMLRAALCAHRLGEQEKAKKITAELAKKFPSSDEILEARKEIQ